LSVIGAISFVSVFFLVRILLRPLDSLEEQAKEISEGNFVIQQNMPQTPELLSVAETMNKMSTKVSQMLTAQTELTEKMRVRAYQDALTGLYNRRYFAERLDHLLKTPEEFISGCLMLIEVSNFKDYNQEFGYVKADELLKKVADIITEGSEGITSPTLARVSGASFAVLLPNVQYEDSKDHAQQIHDQFDSLHYKGKIDGIASTHMGVAYYDGNQDSTELLSMADMALRAAQIKGPNVWHMYDDQNMSQEKVHSSSAWRTIIEKVINNRSLELHYQPVKRLSNNEVIHYEVLARLPDKDGNLIMASTFLPMAQRHGLISGIDIVVIEKLLEHMGDENQISYAVNISKTSLEDSEFIEWLSRTLEAHPERAKSIVFETPEYSIASYMDDIRDSIKKIRELGCRFSIDHFGTGSPDFGYLLNTKVDYIKIDGSYVHGIEDSDDNKFFLKSIAEIAHGLDIEVIGEYVETEQEWKTLSELNMDGGQGHYIGRPTADLTPDDMLGESVNQ
jgi:diguanylate cyclase (GGDEF)-like protein